MDEPAEPAGGEADPTSVRQNVFKLTTMYNACNGVEKALFLAELEKKNPRIFSCPNLYFTPH